MNKNRKPDVKHTMVSLVKGLLLPMNDDGINYRDFITTRHHYSFRIHHYIIKNLLLYSLELKDVFHFYFVNVRKKILYINQILPFKTI